MLSAADAGRAGAAREAGVTRFCRSAARRRSPRWRTAPSRSRASTRSSGPATRGSPPRRRSSRATARSTSTPGRARSSSAPIRGDAGVDRRGSHRAGRARSGRARDLRHDARSAGRARRRRGRGRSCRPTGPARTAIRRQRRASSSRATRARRSRSSTASRPSTSCAIGADDVTRVPRGRHDLRRPLERAGRRRLLHGIESRAADRRRGAVPRRPERRGLRARLHRADADGARHRGASARRSIALAEAEGLTAHAAIRCEVTADDDLLPSRRPPSAVSACISTRTPPAARPPCWRRSRRSRAKTSVSIPTTRPITAAASATSASRRLGAAHQRPRRRAVVAQRRSAAVRHRGQTGSRIGQPGFAAGHHRRAGVRDVRRVARSASALARCTFRPSRTSRSRSTRFSRRSRRDTRLIYLTDPNNPTGLAIPPGAVERIATAAPQRDRARRRGLRGVQRPHVHRPGARSPPQSHRRPDVREGARAGGAPRRRARRASGHARAAPAHPAAVQRQHRGRARARAALDDRAYLEWYVAQSVESRELIYAFCRRHGFSYWPSEANFVLMRVGADAAATRRRCSRARGILVRDQIAAPGCARLHPHHRRRRRPHAALPRRAGGCPCVAHALIAGRPKRTSACGSTSTAAAVRVRTGIRFLDHMLELVARHGGFDLVIARRRAISTSTRTTPSRTPASRSARPCRARSASKRGINRAGYFVMPMDETLAVAAHRSLRPAVRRRRSQGCARQAVGDLPAELVQDFFEGFASAARANVHVKVLYGRSSHHQIEAVFKAFARALRVGVRDRIERLAQDAAVDERTCFVTRSPLVDYGAGNLTSVVKGLAAVGADVRVATDARAISTARARSSSPASATSPRRAPLDDRLAPGDPRRRSRAAAPLLGICLGLQWLFDGSDEAPDLPGLGVFAGPLLAPQRRRQGAARRLEHARSHTPRPSRLLDGIRAGASAYFTHSYAAPVVDATVATTTHGVTFASVGRARPRLRRAVPSGEVRRDRPPAARQLPVASRGRPPDAGQARDRVPRRPRRRRSSRA